MQTSEYSATEKRVVWSIKKFPGATEQTLRIKVGWGGRRIRPVPCVCGVCIWRRGGAAAFALGCMYID